jgi:tripartite ATP-independent transporter DctP family solute receptor
MNNTPRISRRATGKILAAAALAAPWVRAAGATDPITLKFSTADTMNDATYQVGLRFGEEIELHTGGKYKIQMFVGAQLGTAQNLVSSLQTGILDCALITNGIIESFFPLIQVLDLPFIFKDAPTAERILDGEVGDTIHSDMERHNVIGLGWGWFGWRQMETRTKQILHPEDLRGLKMRIQPGPIFVAMFKALDAIPVPIDGSEVYLALSQKTVDGVEFPLPTDVTFKVFEVCKYVALTNHVYNAGAMMVSKALWSKLSSSEQTIFRDAGRISTKYCRDLYAKGQEEAAVTLRQKGMVMSPTDNAEFRKRMTPVYDQFRSNYPQLFDKIIALQA